MLNGQYEEYKVYPKRFLIAGLFALSQFMISVLLNTLNPIAAYLCTIYGQTSVVVNLGGLLFALMHPIFTFPASYVIDTYGTRVGIALGCVLAIIGVGLRMLVNQAFAWVIVGQVIAGIGRPFILNCQAKIAGNWFSAKSRGKVTQILTLVLNVSLVIGILIPGFVFQGYHPEAKNIENIEHGKKITWRLMMIEAVMALVCFIPNIIFQANNPPTPSSASGNIKRQPFKVAIPRMLKNKNYMLLLFAFGCYFGIFNALSIILSYLIKPFFSNEKLPLAVAAVGGSPVISGIIGVIVIGPFQRKSGTFKKWILICMAGSIVAVILFYPLLLTKNLIVVSLISAFNSFFLIPLVPIMLELGCELVFPVGEGSAVGLLFAMGNFAGFLLGLIMSVIVKGETPGQSGAGLGFCLGIFVIGAILIVFMKQEKNREIAESEQSDRARSVIDSIIYSDTEDNRLKEPLIDREADLVEQHDQSQEPPVKSADLVANQAAKTNQAGQNQGNRTTSAQEQKQI